jgi:hypothetical protein
MDIDGVHPRTGSLWTRRWRELDSNFQFRAKGNVQGFVRDGSDRPSVRQYHRTSCLPGQTIEMSGSESTSRRLRLPLSAPGPGVRIRLLQWRVGSELDFRDPRITHRDLPAEPYALHTP